jgi:hypothetical protein
MNFPKAIQCIKEGESIRRESWNEIPEALCSLHDGQLQIYTRDPKKDNKLNWMLWIISEADIYADDWNAAING